MGAIPFDGGCAFRVWAPNASEVTVYGSFNGWRQPGEPLVPEAIGYWSGDVAGVGIGSEYRFLIRNRHEPHLLSRIDPYAREVTHSAGNGVVVRPQRGAKRLAVAREDLVIYELHIGSFHDEPGGAPGSFASASQRLPYLRDLGITAVELMPVNEFAGDFSWGYNPAHLFAVERAYGGREGLARFIGEAHALGIAVIIDVVFNHLGNDDLGIWRFDGAHAGCPPYGGGIYFYNDERAQTPWGHTRPDYGRPEVRQYLRDAARSWLADFGADGLRWDSTIDVRRFHGGDLPDGWSLMQWINDEVHRDYPGAILIAEDMQGDERMARATAAGGAGFDAQWDARFVHTVKGAVAAAEDAHRDVRAVAEVLRGRFDGDPFSRVVYAESHDEVANGRRRIAEDIAPGHAADIFARRRSLIAALLVLTAPGIPMFFQGQEFLEDRWFHDQDPVDWARARHFHGIVAAVRELIRLRRNLDGRTGGLRGPHVNVHHVNQSDRVIACHRWLAGGPGDDVVVVVNLANRRWDHYEVGLPRGGRWVTRFNSDAREWDDGFTGIGPREVHAAAAARDGLAFSGSVSIGPYAGLVLSQ